VAQDLPLLGQFFGVFPTFSWFDECEATNMNALAFPGGHILFGRFMAHEFSAGGSVLPVIAILAHEFGHMHQFANGWYAQGPTVREFELEADAFSGFYGAMMKGWGGEDLNAYYQALFSVGDFNYNDPNHHGTPVQRLAAGALGLLVAIDVLQSGLTPTPGQLHAFFDDRIRNCIVVAADASTCLAFARSADARHTDAEVQSLVGRMDNALLAGIAAGTRSIAEIPRATGSPRSWLPVPSK
jgi:hypothetical protein